MEKIALLPRQLFTGENWLSGYAVLLANGRVAALVPEAEVPADYRLESMPEQWLAPGFIDLQLYGAGGQLLAEYPTAEALHLLCRHCRDGGTTLFQPTVATNSLPVFHQCIDAVRAYWAEGGKGAIGLHLEGPWINPEKKGAHVSAFIHPPEMKEVMDLLEYGKGVVTMITLAPEVCSPDIVQYIRQQGIVLSAGHSAATYRQAMQGFDNGITAVTHLYNAMSPLQHRAPGLVGATFQHPTARASIIADGYHVDFEAVAIAKKIMGDRLFAITDAVTETATGPYQHYRAGDKFESNGILSGSAVSMHQTMVNLVQRAGINVDEALRMCSLYPAQVMGRDADYGRIAPGYAAEFVVLSERLDLVGVWLPE